MRSKRSVPFMLPENSCLVHEDLGRIRFLQHLGDWVLRFVDERGDLVRVPVQATGEPVLLTVPWILQEFAAGRLRDPLTAAPAGRRGGRFLGLDRAACVARDPGCAYRYGWGMAGIEAGIQKSEAQITSWLPGARPVSHPDDPPHVAKRLAVPPSPRSLIRYMDRIRGGDFAIGSCVNESGRMEGEGQLSDVEDRLIQNVALTYHSNPTLSSADDAAALAVRYWQEMKQEGVEGLRHEPPSAEAVRLRIVRQGTPAALACRSSPGGSSRFFDAHGEPVGSSRPFERAYVDGVEYEHACVFSDEWRIPSNKMKSVFVMDDFSQYVFPGPTFTGPFRGETGIQAVVGAMTPPRLSDEEIAANPGRLMHYGTFSDIVYDNDKTMIRPGVVPNAVTLLSTVELARIYGHNVKSKLENFWPFIKRKLRGVPGRILMPGLMRDIRVDPLAAAEATRAVYAAMVDEARREWNDKPKARFGNLSPSQVLEKALDLGINRLTDPGLVLRAFARTPGRLGVLTTNGLEYDGILYRFNREGVGEVLASRHGHTPFDERLQGTAKVLVPMRVWDGNIDFMEVLDESTGRFHRLWSTVPHYTGGLTRWEHAEYKKLRVAGAGGAITEAQRLRDKSRHLVGFDDALPDVAFRARENMATLIGLEQERAAAGVRGLSLNYGRVPECGIAIDVAGGDREDRAAPPPGTRDGDQDGEAPARRGRRNPHAAKAPARPAVYGMASRPGADVPEDGEVGPRAPAVEAPVGEEAAADATKAGPERAGHDPTPPADDQDDGGDLLGGRDVGEVEDLARLRDRWGEDDD